MDQHAIEDIYPLSPAQQGMLFQTLANPQAPLYIEQSWATLEGYVDVTALAEAWQHALDRHAILRTAFAWESLTEPRQVVFRNVKVPIQWHDWRDIPPAEQHVHLGSFLAEDRRHTFDLTSPPLMRLAIIRTPDDAYQVVWTHHHLLLDGWSASLLLHEVSGWYVALLHGAEWRADAPQPYRRYVTWVQRQDLAGAEAFWRRTLRGFTRPTPLGVPANSLDAAGTERYAFQKGRLPPAATATLHCLAGDQHLTANTLLQGAWAAVLSRYSGQKDIVFGTTVSGRPPELPGVESMIGLFINTLPLRIHVEPQLSVSSWLQEIQTSHLEARRYEYCSTGQIHQWTEVPGSVPLYESILVFQNFPVASADRRPAGSIGETDVNRFVGAHTEYPLTILAGMDTELGLRVVFDNHRVDAGSGAKVVDSLMKVLSLMGADPNVPVASLLDAIPDDHIPRVSRMNSVDQHGSHVIVAPRTATEEALAHIWAQVLGVSEVGVHDNFFDLKGHSLLAAQLMSRIRDTFQVEIPLIRVFETPTISGLSQAIEEAVLTEIEALSEEEAQHLLRGET
jgi:acyl carrier protein